MGMVPAVPARRIRAVAVNRQDLACVLAGLTVPFQLPPNPFDPAEWFDLTPWHCNDVDLDAIDWVDEMRKLPGQFKDRADSKHLWWAPFYRRPSDEVVIADAVARLSEGNR